jgi:hypothetical protein
MTFFYVHKFIGFIAEAPKVPICQLFFQTHRIGSQHYSESHPSPALAALRSG